MKLLTAAALEGYRKYTKRILHHARYKIGNNWIETPVDSVEITSRGVVEVTFMINGTGSGTVTAVQLYDNENQLWLQKSESLKLESVATGFLYTAQIEIKEKED